MKTTNADSSPIDPQPDDRDFVSLRELAGQIVSDSEPHPESIATIVTVRSIAALREVMAARWGHSA
jgi:hypothetical protein